MKKIFILFILSVSFPVFSCGGYDYKSTADAAGLDGVNCGIADNLYELLEAINDADAYAGGEEELKLVIKQFMNRLLVAEMRGDVVDIHGVDDDFRATSVIDDTTIYGMFYENRDLIQVGIKGITAQQQGTPITHLFFKPLGFSKFKTANGFARHIMIIAPVKQSSQK